MPSLPVYAAHSDDEALLLVESLLHELIAVGALTIDRAIAVVEIAADARDQIRQERNSQDATTGGALNDILATLHQDQQEIRSMESNI